VHDVNTEKAEIRDSISCLVYTISLSKHSVSKSASVAAGYLFAKRHVTRKRRSPSGLATNWKPRSVE